MANRRIDMRHIRDVLTYLFDRKLSKRQTAAVIGVNRSTVTDYFERFTKAGLSWPLPADLDDLALENMLFSKPSITDRPAAVIDFASVHAEMQKRGATLGVLHAEWLEQTPAEQHISYSQYCKRYNAYTRSLRLSMRRAEVYGETAYVDYSGATINIADSATGESRTAQVFIGVLGGSSYTYCEATWTQRSRDWINSHVRMFEYFGGVPRIIVPDNLKSAVTKADRFSHVLNATYSAMCRHYDVMPFPARARRPKDKARAEGAVLLAQRWILFRLRGRKFFSLEEANREIRLLLDHLNHKPFQKLSGSRYTRWMEHELPTLLPLPTTYEFAEWGKTRVGLDYHIKVDSHHYSVPHELRGKEVEFRMTDKVLEVILKGRSVATHQRSYAAEQATTLDAHRHPAHKAVQQWSEEEALSWAAGLGPNTQEVLRVQLSKVFGPMMGYRMTQAMKSLAKIHGDTRLEEVCAYALPHKITKASVLRTILDKRLDRLLSHDINVDATPDIEHENIRGADYYGRLLTTEKESQA
jgi:transposase